MREHGRLQQRTTALTGFTAAQHTNSMSSKRISHRALLFGALVLSVQIQAATLFQDGFESGSLGAWAASGVNHGRVLVTTNHSPATGQWHLVLDDSVNDALFSVAEATLPLDLSNKRNVVLGFKATSLGNEPHAPPENFNPGTRAFDGVTLSADGGNTWRVVQSLATVGTAGAAFSLNLDQAAASLGGYGPGFRVRFSAYDNASAPLDGIAIDDVIVTGDDDQRVLLEIPSQLREGDGDALGYVLLAIPPTTDLSVSLSSFPAGQLALPPSVVVPAGQTYATFNLAAVDDNLFNLTRNVSVTPSAPGALATSSSVTVLDNDVPAASLNLPTELTEGTVPSNNGRVWLDRTPTVAVIVNLNASPGGEITIPATVTIQPGQTQAVFTVRANDDSRIDGSSLVTVTASNAVLAPVTAQVTVLDNETRVLSVALPGFVLEGTTTQGTISISGTLSNNLVVSLSSADESALTVASTATIIAGQTSANFSFTAVDNTLRDGTRTAYLGASASTFTPNSHSTLIRDNDPASYRFNALSNLVNVTLPLPVVLSALDVQGNVIGSPAVTVNLALVLPDGTTRAVSPSSVGISGAGWVGNVTLPPVSTAPLRLRASDVNGGIGESTSFDILRTLSLTVGDLAWDSLRGRLYASVPASAGGPYANSVVAIDPAIAQVTTNVVTGQNPGQLVMTSGNEFLYAALNGNGTVTRINPLSMTVASTFAVGTDPFFGTLYVEDMCTVAGQPNTLVIAQKRLSVSPRHGGVAAYDNGVIRPAKTQDHTGSNAIEPSASPDIFFGYNTETSEFGLRRLRLHDNGMGQLEVSGGLVGGYGVDIRSAGDRLYSSTGVAVDGAELRRLGSFGVSGPVCPDLAANRVYFIENSDRIGAYDPTTFSNIRRLTLPAPVNSPFSFIRWGTNGLAFRTANSVVLINSGQLVPSAPPADLAVAVQAAPNPANIGVPLAYTLAVSNLGPSIAKSVSLGVVLSDSQTIQSAVASTGTPITPGTNMTIALGDIASGSHAVVTVTVLPTSAGTVNCSAGVNSESIDLSSANNSATKFASVGFQSAPDTVNVLRLAANNILYDSARGLLWATMPATISGPLARTLVAIDPLTGLVSDPLPLNAAPTYRCMALSHNARYLYIGLSDTPEILRLDLENGAAPLRIPMGPSRWGDINHAWDIEPLEGDGTSILVVGVDDHAAAVYDGTVRRTARTGIYSVDRIEPTSSPNEFIGYNHYTSGFELTRLAVTPDGVSVTQSVSSVISGYYVEIQGDAGTIVSSSGLLVDANTLTLRANLGASGRPCFDAIHNRAYIVAGNALRAYDGTTGLTAGNLALPVTLTGDWALECIRWGLDGFAIVGGDGRLYIARWSGAIPPATDSDNDGLPDYWEVAHFNSLTAGLSADADGDGLSNFQEFLFATSPLQAAPSPLQFSVTNLAGQITAHLVFPRRAGLASRYGFITSADLVQWTPAAGVTQTVLSSQLINGIQIETVQALIPLGQSPLGFVRFQWLTP